MRRLIIFVILGLIGWQIYQHYASRSGKVVALTERSSPSTRTAPTLPGALESSAAPYRCDGRIYCSQMRSCEEATYFLRHCPGVKMDGNNDGVPC